jgi:GxxExxY protein
MTHNDISFSIISAAIHVHKQLGPGLIESVYEHCLAEELNLRGLNCKRQVHLPIIYREKELDKAFFIDLLVEDKVIVELKALEVVLPVHESQLLTYLKLSGYKLGLLINFNVPVLKQGIKRKINGVIDITVKANSEDL